MTSETAIALAVFLGGGVVMGAVSYMPPLTTWEAPVVQKQSGSSAEFASDAGYGFCRSQLPGVDCACFSQKAAQVMQNNNERVRGWAYADKWDLARSQATEACS